METILLCSFLYGYFCILTHINILDIKNFLIEKKTERKKKSFDFSNIENLSGVT